MRDHPTWSYEKAVETGEIVYLLQDLCDGRSDPVGIEEGQHVVEQEF
jgi:hypothetical protein